MTSRNNDAAIIMAALNQFLELRVQEIEYGRDVSYIDRHIAKLTDKLPEAKKWNRGKSSNS